MIVAMVILVATISRAGAASTEGGSQKPGKGGGNKGSGQVMKKLDTDKDGQVSKSEFEAAKSKGSARGTAGPLPKSTRMGMVRFPPRS
jgi:hypothetical protein